MLLRSEIKEHSWPLTRGVWILVTGAGRSQMTGTSRSFEEENRALGSHSSYIQEYSWVQVKSWGLCQSLDAECGAGYVELVLSYKLVHKYTLMHEMH